MLSSATASAEKNRRLFYFPLQNAAGKAWLELDFDAQLRRFDGGKFHAVPAVFLHGKIPRRADRNPHVAGFVKQPPGCRPAALAVAAVVKPINLGAGNFLRRGEIILHPFGGAAMI